MAHHGTGVHRESRINTEFTILLGSLLWYDDYLPSQLHEDVIEKVHNEFRHSPREVWAQSLQKGDQLRGLQSAATN